MYLKAKLNHREQILGVIEDQQEFTLHDLSQITQIDLEAVRGAVKYLKRSGLISQVKAKKLNNGRIAKVYALVK